MAWIIDFSSKNIGSKKVYWETVNQPGHFILKAGMGAMITDGSYATIWSSRSAMMLKKLIDFW